MSLDRGSENSMTGNVTHFRSNWHSNRARISKIMNRITTIIFNVIQKFACIPCWHSEKWFIRLRWITKCVAWPENKLYTLGDRYHASYERLDRRINASINSNVSDFYPSVWHDRVESLIGWPSCPITSDATQRDKYEGAVHLVLTPFNRNGDFIGPDVSVMGSVIDVASIILSRGPFKDSIFRRPC